MAEQDKREKWVMGVALTTTILAVCAAISSLRASSYSTKVQICATKEANEWAYYQAKSIKEHTFRLQKESFELSEHRENISPENKDYVEGKIKEYGDEVARYKKEKDEIRNHAEAFASEQEVFKKHNAAFGLAVMLLQIAILMSSVSALIKRRIMWYVGLCFGGVGLVYMANGFFLWFQ